MQAFPSIIVMLSARMLALAIGAIFPLVATTAQAPADSNAATAAKHITAIRKPGVSTEERQRIADQLLALGEEGPRQLARYVGGEVEPRMTAYLAKLEKTATEVIRERVKSNGGSPKVEAEVASLRQKSLAVSRSNGLTKDAIQEKCDPAIARLTELLLVTPEQTAERQTDLAAQRAEVIQFATLYHASLEKLPPEQHKSVGTLPPLDEIEQMLTAREKLACLLSMPMTPQDKATLNANVPIAAKLDLGEALGIAELNRLRLLLGIGVLAIDTKLCNASRDHSKDMKRLDFFDHESPVAGKETPWKRAALAGTKASGENIYEGSERGETAIKVWWYSPGHHANMMGGARRVGMGREDKFFTQMFGG